MFLWLSLYQVIFHTLPSLTGVIEEELIPANSFVTSSVIWSQPNPPFPITCTNPAIINAAAMLLGHSSIDEDSEATNRPNTQQRVSCVLYTMYASIRSFGKPFKICKKSNFDQNQLKIDKQNKNMYMY